MEKFENHLKNHEEAIDQNYLISADQVIEEVYDEKYKELEDSEKEEKILSLLEDYIKTLYIINPEPKNLKYIWDRLKFSLKPKTKGKTKNHERISLARAMYIYENLAKKANDKISRNEIDDAISNYLEDQPETPHTKEAERIFSEAKLYSEKYQIKLLPFSFAEIMKSIGYSEKDTYSILNYYRDFRKSLLRINLNSKDELKIFAKALKIFEKNGHYRRNNITEISDNVKRNATLYLTSIGGVEEE